jgi:hypothetical protein
MFDESKTIYVLRHFIQCDGGKEYWFKLVFLHIKPYEMETLGFVFGQAIVKTSLGSHLSSKFLKTKDGARGRICEVHNDPLFCYLFQIV